MSSSGACDKQSLICLMCGKQEVRNSLLAHIAGHFNYHSHKCTQCAFTAVTAEQMQEHEAQNEHIGQLYAHRSSYLDRLCRFVFNDCEFGEKNGGLENVLKRKMIGEENEEVINGSRRGLKAEESNSTKVHQWVQQQIANNSDQQQFYAQSSSQKLQQMIMGGGAQPQQPFSANFLADGTPEGQIQANARSNALNTFIAQQNNQQNQVGGGGHHQQQHFGEQYMHGPAGQMADAGGKAPKKLKQQFEQVQCLKCAQWVKGRGICLLYHMNTRHLKLPLYRCLACPRDFFYVTDTTAKNHIRSFHGNDLSLLEVNYHAYSRMLHDSRREFFGPALIGCEGRRIKNVNPKKGGRGGRGAVQLAAQKHRKVAGKLIKQVSLRERPQSGSGTGGNSSHVQCLQCGEFVASIYSSQLSHINTKHVHLAIYTCRECGRPFESLSSSAAVMHIKSVHGRTRETAEAEIVDQRDACLKQLNERYRQFFSFS